MKIYCLIENTPGKNQCEYEHGLSLFVETEKHRILCDAGQSYSFSGNASMLNVNPASADILFLSHGHYDHADGFELFAWLPCHKEKMYLQKSALLPHYHGERYIGIKRGILNNLNTVALEGDYRIDDELFIFSDIRGRRLFPKGNLELTTEIGGEKLPDDFSHEQCLVIRENDVNVLISGCAHNGIVNILDRYKEIFGVDPDYVISGFHMMKNSEYTKEDIELIEDTARELNGKNTVFYTGHCTGQPAFDIMKNIMGDKLRAIHSGEKVLEILTKSDLRNDARVRHITAGREYHHTADKSISEKVISSEEFRNAKSIFIYVSTENEPYTDEIINAALESGKRVCVPKCVSKSEMKAVEIRNLNELRIGTFGIREPESAENEVNKDEFDLAIIPCVAASENGKRLGHGAGYYDRFLEGTIMFRMCLCYGRLIFDDIPTDEHDIIMDKIITE